MRTFQSLELFEDLTVEDNLLVAAQPPRWSDWIFDVFHISRVTPEIRANVDRALDLVELQDVRRTTPINLSHGQRKLVGVARALVMQPKLVLLDEPAAGLDSEESLVFGRRMRSLLETGLSVFMIEHDMGLVLSVCDYIYVLDFGRIIAEGTPAEVRDNPLVDRRLPRRVRLRGARRRPSTSATRASHDRPHDRSAHPDRGHVRRLRGHPGGPRAEPARRPRRGGGPARTERRRQDDHAPHVLRHRQGAGGLGRRSSANRCTTARPTAWPAAASGTSPRTARSSSS